MHHVSSGTTQSGVVTSVSATISGSRLIEWAHSVTILITPLAVLPPPTRANAPIGDSVNVAIPQRVGG